MDFKLVSPYQSKGDQPEAIRQLVEGLGQMIEHRTAEHANERFVMKTTGVYIVILRQGKSIRTERVVVR